MAVLVTGGAGFLAGWCVKALVERGETVRATVRSRDQEAAVRAWLGDPPGLSFVVADLDGGGWDEAVAGCTGVLHVASPTTADGDPVAVAREGTLRVLRAAVAAGVPRVVMVSCAVAAEPAEGFTGTVDESVWTGSCTDVLQESKVAAERAAWDFMAAHPGTSFATVLPGTILGPVRERTPPSVEVVESLLAGLPPFAGLRLDVVDVRDVAALLLRALRSPLSGRFLAVAGSLTHRQIAQVLKAHLGVAGVNVRTWTLPGFALRLAARREPALRPYLPMVGRKYTVSSARARSELAWRPRPTTDTVADCGRSLPPPADD